MIKKFIIGVDNNKNNIVKDLTFNEYFELCENSINYKIKEAMAYNNNLEYDNLYQELSIACWKSYNDYDISKGVKYTTYLTHKMQQRISNMFKKSTAKKRSMMKTVSVDEQVELFKDGGTSSLLDTLKDTMETEETITYKELRDYLLKQISNEKEKILVYCILNKDPHIIKQIANKIGMTPQALSQAVLRFRRKLAKKMQQEFNLDGYKIL